MNHSQQAIVISLDPIKHQRQRLQKVAAGEAKIIPISSLVAGTTKVISLFKRIGTAEDAEDPNRRA
jgi:hypothetical protein